MIEFLEKSKLLVERAALLAALENTTLHVEVGYFPWDKKERYDFRQKRSLNWMSRRTP